MTLQRQRLGKSGENRAVEELERRGYAILARRYRTRHGEIDVVARDGETTVFVEVKARTTGEFGLAAEAVTPWKQRRLVAMATDYLVRHRLTGAAVPVRRGRDRPGRRRWRGPQTRAWRRGIERDDLPECVRRVSRFLDSVSAACGTIGVLGERICARPEAAHGVGGRE